MATVPWNNVPSVAKGLKLTVIWLFSSMSYIMISKTVMKFLWIRFGFLIDKLYSNTTPLKIFVNYKNRLN